MLSDGLADHRPKHTMKVIGRKMSQSRQSLQDQLFIEVLLDMKLHPQNTLAVGLLRHWYAHDR